jgi:hypothetical protein
MFLETPLERLHLDTELVRSVSHDPDLVRKLARSSFRTILTINHPDIGGDGSLVDAASDAMAEINGADDEGINGLVAEFFAERDDEEGATSHRQEYLNQLKDEQSRRIEETETLLECSLAEKPRFQRAFIELGITHLRGVQ